MGVGWHISTFRARIMAGVWFGIPDRRYVRKQHYSGWSMIRDALAVNTEQACRALPMTCRANGLVLKQVKRTETVAMYSVHFTEDDPPHGYEVLRIRRSRADCGSSTARRFSSAIANACRPMRTSATRHFLFYGFLTQNRPIRR